ncbi:MAG: cytidine deaminase [Alphaproteobacteria bacterium]|nr:cytidine deaminase [Alphaproteobacteria bacterium]
MQTLSLPELTIPEYVTETPLGKLVVPGQTIPQRLVVIDPALIRQLIEAARLATETAYHNYSTAPFAVGAACIMADDGEAEIFTAANAEMAVLNGGICAERALLHYVVAKGFRRIKYLAVSTPNRGQPDITGRSPCGLCRQTMAGFSDADTLILIDRDEPGMLCDVLDMARLLPFGYRLQF